jgi:uncharacterized metal-binding protein
MIVTVGFLFGGLMFGPDLDTGSRQYARWSLARPIWLPYRALFTHRSRFTHGLLFSSLLRVLYFHAVLALCGFGVIWIFAWYTGGHPPGVGELMKAWSGIGGFARSQVGEHGLLLLFAGVWLGAASHTITDLAGSFIKTGRAGKVA